MSTFSKAEIKDGVRRLKALKARFKSEKSLDGKIGDASPLASSLFAHLTPGNFRAVVVYRRSRGWYADVLLKDLPAGIPDAIGTPLNHPHASREEAEEAAWVNFRMVMHQAVTNEAANADGPRQDVRVFDLHGMAFRLPGRLVDELAAMATMLSEGQMGTVKEARQRMAGHLEEIMGSDTFIEEKWEAATDQQRNRVMASMIQQMVLGSARYPPNDIEPTTDEPETGDDPEDGAEGRPILH